MSSEVLGKKSPLFGRRTAQIHLTPFGHREATAFHPKWSLEEQARAYFMCGGVPLYLKTFAPERSVEQNIEATQGARPVGFETGRPREEHSEAVS